MDVVTPLFVLSQRTAVAIPCEPEAPPGMCNHFLVIIAHSSRDMTSALTFKNITEGRDSRDISSETAPNTH